jgi:hypothetical protein
VSEAPLLAMLDDPFMFDVILEPELIKCIGHQGETVAKDVGGRSHSEPFVQQERSILVWSLSLLSLNHSGIPCRRKPRLPSLVAVPTA